MSRLPAVVLVCLAALVAVATEWVPASAAGGNTAEPASDTIVVELDQSRLDVGPGDKLSFVSTVRNDGPAPLQGYVAQLNILTTDASVYVDPEDWSPRRTQYLDVLGPGDSVELTWEVQAVTAGPLIIYISVASPEADGVVSSGPLNLTVTGQRVVSSTAVEPVVLWTPATVLLLLGATYVRRRRHR